MRDYLTLYNVVSRHFARVRYLYPIFVYKDGHLIQKTRIASVNQGISYSLVHHCHRINIFFLPYAFHVSERYRTG